jgi:hypothetical protein
MVADANVEPANNLLHAYTGEERRRHVRIDGPFPAIIRSRDSSNNAFEVNTLLNNLSAGGFYLRLEQRLEPGIKLFAVINLSNPLALKTLVPRVAVRGTVQRVELQSDGQWGVGVRFTRHRFL